MPQNPFAIGSAVIGAIGLAFVVWAAVVPDEAASLLPAAGACLAIAGIGWLFSRRLGSFVYAGRKVLKTGIKAEARVLQRDEADVVVNGNPVLELELRVSPRNKPPFDTTLRQLVPKAKAPAVQVGTKVPVRIDPTNRTQVVLELAAFDPKPPRRGGRGGGRTTGR